MRDKADTGTMAVLSQLLNKQEQVRSPARRFEQIVTGEQRGQDSPKCSLTGKGEAEPARHSIRAAAGNPSAEKRATRALGRRITRRLKVRHMQGRALSREASCVRRSKTSHCRSGTSHSADVEGGERSKGYVDCIVARPALSCNGVPSMGTVRTLARRFAAHAASHICTGTRAHPCHSCTHAKLACVTVGCGWPFD
jgi:hypothetical protein